MSKTEFISDTARELLARHAAEWARLPIRPIRSPGTDNAMLLLGDDHALRIPKDKTKIPSRGRCGFMGI